MPGESTAFITFSSSTSRSDVHPGAVEIAFGEPRDDALPPSGDSLALDLLDREARDRGSRDVAVVLVPVGVLGFPLAGLDRICVRGQWTVDARPLREQCLSAAGRERQVHARGGSQRERGVVIAGMKEVAVPVDVHEPAATGEPRAVQARRASRCNRRRARAGIARPPAPRGHRSPSSSRKRAQRVAIADSRAASFVESQPARSKNASMP